MEMGSPWQKTYRRAGCRWALLGTFVVACAAVVVLETRQRPARAQNASGETTGASTSEAVASLYSTAFHVSPGGVPVVPISVAEGGTRFRLRNDQGLMLLPAGEGGPEIEAGKSWILSIVNGRPARLRYFSIVWRSGAGGRRAAHQQVELWRGKGHAARVFERGALFSMAGEIVDRRELVVAVGPFDRFQEAESAHETLSQQGSVSARGVHVEVLSPPSGTVEAVSENSGAKVRSQGALWLKPARTAQSFRASGSPEAPRASKSSSSRATRADTAPQTSVEVFQARAAGVRDKPWVSVGRYRGVLYAAVDREGQLVIVNALPANELLYGLVPSEIYPRAPMESLKAQAVAARGHLLSKIGRRHAGQPFRLCSQTHCQVYGGADKEEPRTTAAVAQTRGELLFSAAEGGLADTVYSASCGGHSESNHHVWNSMPPDEILRGHFDGPSGDRFDLRLDSDSAVAAFLNEPPKTWDSLAPLGGPDRFRWRVTRSPDDLARSLKAYGVGRVVAVDVLKRGVSGRALRVRVRGTRKTVEISGELRIRRAFGGLRSALFVASVADGAVTFSGGGFGHGVGLCQTGSMGMASAGKQYTDILRHYYPGSVLKKLW